MIKKLLQPEVQKFIKDHQNDDPFLLSLNSKVETDFPIKEAILQIESFQKARGKLNSYISNDNIIWPPPISIEQASSDITAKYKSSLVHGRSIVDLTGGSGIDTSFFAKKFDEVHYVEPNAHLCELTRYNFKILGKNIIQVHHQSAEVFIKSNQQRFDAIFIDPSRRDDDKRVFKIEDCSPNLYNIIPHCLKVSDQILVKLSPLVDITFLINDFQPTSIWVVAVKYEVKEVLCLIQNDKKPTTIHAVELNEKSKNITEFAFQYHEESEATIEFSLPLKFLYEPSAAVLKSGAFKLIGQHYKLKKLHQHTHLYTSDELILKFPGKTLEIVAMLRQNKKEISRVVHGKKINVITRNFPLSASQLKKKYGLKDGGEEFLIGTTLMDEKKVLLQCRRHCN